MATTITDRFTTNEPLFGVTTRDNQFPQASEFDGGAWFKNRASVVGDVIAAPDGSITADALYEDGTLNDNHVILQDLTPDGQSQYTLSVFAKAGNRSWLRLNFGTPGFDLTNGWFDLTNGVLGFATDAIEDHVITDMGDGWYRCSITATSVAPESGSHRISIGDADNSPIFDGLSQLSFYLWHAKFEIGSGPSPVTAPEGAATDRFTGTPSENLTDRMPGYLQLQSGDLLLLQSGGYLNLQSNMGGFGATVTDRLPAFPT